MSDKALATRDSGDVFSLANALYESGYFTDVKSASQAIVKVLYGREIGLSPVASMRAIYISRDGSPTVHAEVLSAAIRNSGRYDFQIIENTDKACELAFFRLEGGAWTELGRSRFTMEDAKTAGIAGKDVWQKYPRNLLFARAMSNGKRWYCPDVASGFYTPEELDTGPALPVIQVVEPVARVAEVVNPPEPSGNGNGSDHPFATPEARKKFMAWACGAKALQEGEVHIALGIEHLEEYVGTKKQALEAVNAYIEKAIAAQVEAATVEGEADELAL